MATAPAVRDAVREYLEDRPDLVRIDISEVSFCDGSGLGALLWAKTEAARAGSVCLLHHAQLLPVDAGTTESTDAVV